MTPTRKAELRAHAAPGSSKLTWQYWLGEALDEVDRLERELADTRHAHELLEQEVMAKVLQGAAAGTVRLGPTEEQIEAMPRRPRRRR